jgi:FKBP-type peptidyl-prolyl cis-trans isomerase 2
VYVKNHPKVRLIRIGKKVRLAFELTVDGQPQRIVYSGKPISYIQGKSTPEFPRGLAKQLSGMALGQRKRVSLTAKQGYGLTDPNLVMVMPRSRFARRYHFVGRRIVSEKDGKHLAFVKDVKKDTLVIDFNHPLAGKNLRYDVHVVGIEGEGMIPAQERKAP